MRIAFAELPNLASEMLGAKVVEVSDDFFAPKENLLKEDPPVFIPDKYTENGKWMDGWESRRKRSEGHDYCTIQLGCLGRVRGVCIDTSYFVGNAPAYGSVEGSADGENWKRLLDKQSVLGGVPNYFAVYEEGPVGHLRLNIFPDGGVARFRAFGEIIPNLDHKGPIDLAALLSGATVVGTSDQFFSHKNNLILPGRSQFMSGGWETRRRRGPYDPNAHDWLIIRFYRPGHVQRIEIDTDHYRGNFPESAEVLGLLSDNTDPEWLLGVDAPYESLLSRSPLKAHQTHVFEVQCKKIVNTLKLLIYPDGGIARLRAFCHV